MNEITATESDIEHVARFQSLQAGQYWKALKPVIEEGIDQDEVLLIQSIRWVDDAPHTIILRPHPSKFGTQTYLNIPQEDGTTEKIWFRYDEHRFLLNDFLAAFEFEPDHQRIRSDEIRMIQGKINDLQNELLEAQSNPALLAAVVETGLRAQAQEQTEASNDAAGSEHKTSLPTTATSRNDLSSLATGTVAAAIGTGITAEGIASLREAVGREHQVATIKSEWIQGKTSEIATTIKAMTPFYEEQAAAALAQTEDVRAYVSKLMRGIESLDLYVGKDVEVDTIRTGQAATRDVPLTFVQRKLMMDEELAVWADIDEWFDFSKEDKFFDALRAHDSLVNQIFPTERCILVMAITRRYIDYGDSMVNMTRNAENNKVFLLVRDGMNIHRVFSPVESHLGTARLFPSKDDQDRIFRGSDGSQIKFEDVAYTDKLSAHEKFALHYKRFLLLVCGLDHRLKLFGDFYEGPQTLHFVSMDFQEAYCRFLHDDDGSSMLPGEKRTPLQDWIKEKNDYLRSGSRVLCNWFEVMNPTTAPSACKEEHGRDSTYIERRYKPANTRDVVIASRDRDSICVDVEVSGYSYTSHGNRTFKSKVNLSKFKDGHWDYTDLPFLCLDAVRPEELHWYIHNRNTRKDQLSYIRFFKEALKYIQQDLKSEGDTRQRMAKALTEGNIADGDEAETIINEAVIAWRAANRGKPLPQFENGKTPAAWKPLLDQMYMLAGEGKRQASDIAAFVHQLGYEPLRLVLSGGAKLIIYAAPRDEERDNRLEPHAWVHRITVERGKTGYTEKSRRWTALPKSAASETTLHQWEEVNQWSALASVFPSYERKQEVLGRTLEFVDRLHPFAQPMDTATHAAQLEDWEELREELLRDAKYVLNPFLAVPFGVVYYPRTNELQYLCASSYRPHRMLYKLAPNDNAREHVRQSFIRPYAKKDKGQHEFTSAAHGSADWVLTEVSISLSARYGVFSHSTLGVFTSRVDGQRSHDPLLANWFENWQSEVQRHSAAKVWLADGALNEDGKLVLDDLLAIQRPEGYEPLNVVEIKLHSRDGEAPPELFHWFDISSVDEESRRPDRIYETQKKLVPESAAWSSSTYVCTSRSEAHEFIKEKVADMDEDARAVPATELPDATPAPEGVERWYVVV